MKRSLTLALSVVLAAGIMVPAMAQDNFPDAPANHWAYEALAKMKQEGLLVGYPDGLYRGNRPASRYELACAMYAVYTNLKNLIDGMQTQLDLLKGINPQDIQNLKDQVAQLQNEVNAMKGWGDDIAALKKATEQFDKELRQMGADVEGMKRDLGDLAERVTRLEKRKPSVDIHGDISFWAGTSNSEDGRAGLNMDGRIEGNSGGFLPGGGATNPAPIGLFHDLAILHEGAFTFNGTNDTGPKWKATVVVGNMLGAEGFGSQSSMISGGGIGPGGAGIYGFEQGAEDVYVQDAEVRFDTGVSGLKFTADVGRVGYKISPYMFQRINPESYYSNERWDNGEYHLDGAILGFNFGPVKMHVFGGNNSNELSVDGVDLNPTVIANNRFAGGSSEGIYGTNNMIAVQTVPNGIVGVIDKTAGVDASFGLGANGHVNLAYLLFEQEAHQSLAPGLTPVDNLVGSGGANRDSVFGGDADFTFGRIKLSGGYHISDLTDNDSAVNSNDNKAWNAKIGYSADRFNLWGGYREVDQYYYAPGDWGRLGILQNPANIQGWQAGGYFDITHAVRLSATGEWDKGAKDPNGGGGSLYGESLFDKDSVVQDYMARLDVRLSPNASVYGSYDYTRFADLASQSIGTPASEFGWTTFGVGYGLSANAKLNIQYQFSNVFNFGAYGNTTGRWTGGFLTSQLSVKF